MLRAKTPKTYKTGQAAEREAQSQEAQRVTITFTLPPAKITSYLERQRQQE